MAINAPPETTPRMPPPSTTSPSFVLSPQSSRPSLRRPRRRSTSLTTGWSGPGCVLEVLGVFEEAIMLEAPLDAPLSCWWLVLPELLEPAGGQFCIAHSMADVPMAQVLLDRTGVVPFVGQLESARVPQHMRVNRERKARRFADARDKLPNGRGGQGASALGREHVGACRLLLPLESPECSDLRPSKRMSGGQAALQPSNMQQPSHQIHLLPTE